MHLSFASSSMGRKCLLILMRLLHGTLRIKFDVVLQIVTLQIIVAECQRFRAECGGSDVTNEGADICSMDSLLFLSLLFEQIVVGRYTFRFLRTLNTLKLEEGCPERNGGFRLVLTAQTTPSLATPSTWQGLEASQLWCRRVRVTPTLNDDWLQYVNENGRLGHAYLRESETRDAILLFLKPDCGVRCHDLISRELSDYTLRLIRESEVRVAVVEYP